MKKTTKNPITFFREANEKRQATVKNSLKKAQVGMAVLPKPEFGPKTEAQTMMESMRASDDPMAYGRGPRTTSLRQDINQEMRDATTNTRVGSNRMTEEMRKLLERNSQKNALNEMNSNYSIDPSTGKMIDMGRQKKGGSIEQYKKGGSAKPSAGLSKKTKSNIAKKASAGKDIGKKGKGFAKVAAAAGGGEKGKRIAAAAMWKNVKRG